MITNKRMNIRQTLLCLVLFGLSTSFSIAQTWSGSTQSTGFTHRDGAVGIGPGTAQPATMLDVNGTTTFRGNVNMVGDRWFTNNGNNNNGYIRFYGGGNTIIKRIVIDGGYDLWIRSDIRMDDQKNILNANGQQVLRFPKTNMDGFNAPLRLKKRNVSGSM